MPNKVTLKPVDGNIFAQIGAFRKAAYEQGWTVDEVDDVVRECMEHGDVNILSIFYRP